MVEAEYAIEVTEESRVGVFEDIAERPVERAQAGRRAPSGPQTEALGVGVPLDRSRAGEALQVEVRIAQLDVDFVLGTVALVVEHQRAAETIGVQSAVFQEGECQPGLPRDNAASERRIALDVPEREVEDGSKFQLVSEREIPADAAGPHHAVPLHREPPPLLAIRRDKDRVVLAIAKSALQVEWEALTHGKAAATRDLGEVGVVGLVLGD